MAWQFLDDLRCAHGKIITPVWRNSSGNFSDEKRESAEGTRQKEEGKIKKGLRELERKK